MNNLSISKASTSGTPSHMAALAGNVEQEPLLFNSNPAPINRTPINSPITPVSNPRTPITSDEQRLERAQKFAELCQADIHSTTNALVTISLLIGQAECFSQQVCEVDKRVARGQTSQAFRADPKAAVKELREARREHNEICDSIDLVVHELVKLMVVLENRAKDAADSKCLDDMARRIQSWGDPVGGINYMSAATIYEQKRQALQAQTR